MGKVRSIGAPRGVSGWIVVLASLLGASLQGSPVQAACDRVYTVSVPEGGSFGFTQLMMAELTRRTGCAFELKNMPVARAKFEWKAGTVDIASAMTRTPEWDEKGTWAVFAYSRQLLISSLPPPGKTLEGWLNLPQRPVLGLVRLAATGGAAADRLLALPRYSAQVDEASDRITLVRKLLAKRDLGIITTAPGFDLFVKELGGDGRGIQSYPIEEIPRTPYGLYFRSPQVPADDQRLLVSTLADMMKSGFLQATLAGIVGETIAAQIYDER